MHLLLTAFALFIATTSSATIPPSSTQQVGPIATQPPPVQPKGLSPALNLAALGSFAQDAAEDAADNLQDMVSDAVSGIQEAASETAGNVQDKMADMADGISDLASSAAEAATEGVDSIAGGVESAMDEVPAPQTAAENLEDLVDGIQDANEDALEIVGDAVSTMRDALEGVEPETLSSDTGDISDDINADVGEGVDTSDDANDTNDDDDNDDENDDDDDGNGDNDIVGNEFIDDMLEIIEDEMNNQSEDILDQATLFNDNVDDDVVEAIAAVDDDVNDNDNDDDFYTWMLENMHSKDSEDDDVNSMSTFTKKMSRMKQFMDVVESELAESKAARLGTCPMYPVNVSTDKVTITTQNGCKIIIKLKGTSVDGIHSVEDNLTDPAGLHRSVEVTYTKDE